MHNNDYDYDYDNDDYDNYDYDNYDYYDGNDDYSENDVNHTPEKENVQMKLFSLSEDFKDIIDSKISYLFNKDPKWKDALSNGELKNYKDDIYYNVDEFGHKRYWKNGKKHRDDGPALEYSNGSKYWYMEGKLHRLDGPAIEYANGYKQWWIEGKEYTEEEFNKIKNMEFEKDPKWKHVLNYGDLTYYKNDVYFIKNKHGEYYWKDGKFHRDDGPAIEYSDGSKFWYKEGKLHREDGPAVEYNNGKKRWFIDGSLLSEKEFNEKTKLINFKNDPRWENALTFGELKHYKDEIYYNVDRFGNKTYWSGGYIHRDDGPAVEYSTGSKEWFKDGKLHRLDGPASESANGNKEWYIKGKKYTQEEFKQYMAKDNTDTVKDNNHIINKEGEYYYKDGKLHREDGPAIILESGDKEWWLNGKLHRENGPAIEYSTGAKEWYKEGKRHRLDGPAVEGAYGHKVWFIEGKEYTEEEFNKQLIVIKQFEKDPNWKYALRFGDLKHYKDEIYYNIDSDGNKSYWKNGLAHREDGPSFEGVTGFKSWCQENEFHRLDGPAIEFPNGTKFWYIKGIRYQKKQFDQMIEIKKDPKWALALHYGNLIHYKDETYYNVDKFCDKRYWRDGNLERDDGPACEMKNGTKFWCKNNKFHRLDGPAVENINGHKGWWIEGEVYSEEEFNKKINSMNLNKSPNWDMASIFGKLTSYKDDIYYNVDVNKTIRYWKDNKLHREDGPAVETSYGDKFWYINGKLHREDGPAVHESNETKYWYIDGIPYIKEQFDQIIQIKKDQKWEQALKFGTLKFSSDGSIYNIDQFGTKRFWKEGQLHNEKGPACFVVEQNETNNAKKGQVKRDLTASYKEYKCKLWYKEGKLHRLDGPAIEYKDGTKKWYIDDIESSEEEYNHKIKIMELCKDPKWEHALGYGQLKHYKDEVYYNTDEYGNKHYWKDGKFHRDDGPAVEYANGNKNWLKEDKYHRLDGPAIEQANGIKSWWIEGENYTEEEFNHKIKMMELEKDSKWKKALSFGELKHYKDDTYYNVDEYGTKFHWKDAKLHRDDGPAIEWKDGRTFWYKEGKCHRLDGPAIEQPDGTQEWFIDGKEYTEEQFNSLNSKNESILPILGLIALSSIYSKKINSQKIEEQIIEKNLIKAK